ncbi:hypothetical protein LTR17_025971 [Elasticomyces elasticus]|nr:hypothetical protein LTR17_025971 [Elasticomyces elasticus]
MDTQLPNATNGTRDHAALKDNHGISEATSTIHAYLKERAPEFHTLITLCQEASPVDQSKGADEYFAKQRQMADKPTAQGAKFIYDMMKGLAHDLHDATGVFDVLNTPPSSTEKPSILDFCMAPGGFLDTAMRHNSSSTATAFSLDPKQGGHEVYMPQNPRSKVKYIDITMLAADMGVTSIPEDHPDYANFLPRELSDEQKFDMVICDGQVLREHSRAGYREKREVTRLLSTQLKLGLEHLRSGGTMVVKLHKLEAYDTARLVSQFSKIAKIELFKHKHIHAPKSSFYMLATEVQSECEEATKFVEGWRKAWEVATFGTDEEYEALTCATQADAEEMLAGFGDQLVEIGRPIWDIQTQGLQRLVKKIEVSQSKGERKYDRTPASSDLAGVRMDFATFVLSECT